MLEWNDIHWKNAKLQLAFELIVIAQIILLFAIIGYIIFFIWVFVFTNYNVFFDGILTRWIIGTFETIAILFLPLFIVAWLDGFKL